ncbi:MAG: DUF262 domain-containing protein [Acidimicrobiia bacterium]
MEAKALTPRDLFDGKVCYEIPAFQRPYVWTEEDQWQPLWDDIARVTDAVIDIGEDEKALAVLAGHFLGAVVVKQLASAAGDPLRSSVIDGQQRLTTLQLLLDAAQLVMEQFDHEDVAESLQELVLNDSKRFRATPKRFKLWPSRIDRVAFEHVMDNELAVPDDVVDNRISQAHRFFRAAIAEWAEVTGDPEKAGRRLAALAQVLQRHLQIVAIDLSGNDDDQLIFETLNDRGTPLLAADLIKNYVFQRCEDLGADVDGWSDTYWRDFDDDWWRDQVSQGRMYRSRIDLFLQYWLTMRIKDEIPTDAVFARFRGYANEQLAGRAVAEQFLAGLRRDADTFRDFAQLDPRSARGSFYTRVVEALELGAFIPLLLWLISEHHEASADQSDKALAAVESWAVRRTLLRRTMKDVNKLVVALLKELDEHPAEVVGDATVAYLRAQTADARTWPMDEELLTALPTVKAYGNIKQQRLRALLAGVELQLRSERHEEVTLPAKLEIEHVMPQGWRSYWGAGIANDLEAATRRDHLVNTIGNLTLVTQKLNVALSNRPWTDAEAQEVAPTGKDAGLGKRSLLNRYSVLLINKDIVDPHEQAWSEQDIATRNTYLATVIAEVWPVGG